MKQPVPRKDAFFGLHFDLHPGKDDKALGADVTEENIGRLLDRVRPDFVQYDCKGHSGYAGFLTKTGWSSPGIVKDSLAIWREATRERGVALFIHYSGVWDAVAVQHHPEWACVNADGKPDTNITSTFGAYRDELMIPQLKEACAAYDLDGVWADGECWAAKLDYSTSAVEQWRRETGFDRAPKSKEEPHWLEWKQFHRRGFELHAAKWVDALHAFNPALQLTSNWMYTTYLPKPVTAGIDFISGDYSAANSVDTARLEARYLANTGMPWDLMAWGFNGAFGQMLKPAVHLKQEAAVVLMQGGGTQLYYQPTRAGHVAPQIIDTAGEVADFCRERQAFTHRSKSVPQIALLLSAESLWERMDEVCNPSGCLNSLQGALHALLEMHYPVDVLAEHQLEPRLAEYPVVVIAGAHRAQDGFRDSVRQYVRNGGRLLLLGEDSCVLFDDLLGAKVAKSGRDTGAEIPTPSGLATVNGGWLEVTPASATVVHRRYPDRKAAGGGEVASTIAMMGKGQVASVYGPAAERFFESHHPAIRSVIGGMMERLIPDPVLRVDAPPCVDVSLRRSSDGILAVHLLNLANAQRGDKFLATEFIPEAGPIRFQLRLDAKPRRVRLEPGNRHVAWTWADGVLSAELPALRLYEIAVIQ